MSERSWRYRLHAVCSGMLLLLCAAVALAWAASYSTHYALAILSWRAERCTVTTINIRMTIGGLSYFRADDVFGALDPDGPQREWSWRTEPAAEYPGQNSAWSGARFNRGGFVYLHYDSDFPHADDPRAQVRAHRFGWVVPMWSVWLLTAIPAALGVRGWLRRARRRRRLSRGLCPTCGYDVTPSGSPSCPECGTEITREPLRVAPSATASASPPREVQAPPPAPTPPRD